jgi:bla regulator protein BlaR1
MEERELACDEEVLLRGGEPEAYAEGIIEICKSYVGSPVACVSGISGADLKRRIVRIVNRRVGENLSPGRRLLLSAIAIAAIAGPLGFGLLSAPRLRGQSSQTASAPLPSFDVASVKANKSGVRGGTIDAHAGRLTITNIPLRMCIRAAFHLQDYQLSGGPGWLTSERFDIIATTDAPTADEQLLLLLQNVLADRFKLAMHRETKEMEESALLVGKDGPKLKRVEPAGHDWVRTGVGRITGQEVSMLELANTLAQKLGHPVADQTGLSGVFDITLEWIPDSATPVNPAENKEAPSLESTSDPSGPSIFTAVQEQLGLRLEPRKGAVDVYVIDHVEEPTPN